MIALGIDVGSSAIKGVLCDANIVVRSERVPMPPRLDVGDPLKYEHDALQVRDACFELVQKLASNQNIDAIAFTGQMHGGLVVDRDLDPLTNIVTWQDRRQNSKLQLLREALGDDPTGVGIHPGFLVATVAQITLPHGAAYVLGIYDWIASLLAGRVITDISSAAAWGMYDPIKKQWRDAVLACARIPTEMLPTVFEPGAFISTILSTTAQRLNVSSEIKLFAGTGDTQATYIGSGCDAGDLLLNFGTGSQSMWQTDRPEKSRGVDVRYLSMGRWLATSPTEAGGEAYRVFAEFVRDVVSEVAGNDLPLERIFQRLNDLGERSSAEGINFDPAFAGSKVRHAAGGSIDGLSRQNFQIAPLTAALLDGMVHEIADPYFEREGNRTPNRLVGGGSAMRMNPALRKAAERLLGMAVELPAVDFEAAYGAAQLCVLRENGG
jgi:sugar (pentulose or hexulose) kinase